MKNLIYLVFALAPAFGQVTIQSAPNPTINQAVQIVQAMVGINPQSQTTPCLSPITTCYGVPPGNVVVQPQPFLTQGVTVNWYAVFQTGNWQGGVKAVFDFIENGTIVQTEAPSMGILSDSTLMLVIGSYIPKNGYVGPAFLRVTTTATSRSGDVRTLQSSALVQVTQ